MPKVSRRLRPSISSPSETAESSSSPRVVVRAVSVVAIFVERDEGVAKLGGESNKSLAMDKMHGMAAKFFEAASNLDR